jgi:hypothetical protein
MKFGSFFTKRTYQVEPSPASLLKQFALELDKQLTAVNIQIINGPGAKPRDLQLALNTQDALMQDRLGKLNLKLIQTDKGPLYTTTPLSELETQPITLATHDNILKHYTQLALIICERKKANCEGLAAVVLFLSNDLTKMKAYQKIEVQICQLDNWGHLFVRFKHPDDEQALFYDPWYQRSETTTPTLPLLITEPLFSARIEQMIQRASMPPHERINHTSYIRTYDIDTRQLSYDTHTQQRLPPTRNDNVDYQYSILCSSGPFSNPAKIKIEEPNIKPSCFPWCC